MSDPASVAGVIDASAVLAFLKGEPGHEQVAERLEGSVISAVNWAEVRGYSRGQSLTGLRESLGAAGLAVVDFTAQDAEMVGDMFLATQSLGLSLAERACLALAHRMGVHVLTAERKWAQLELGIKVELIR